MLELRLSLVAVMLLGCERMGPSGDTPQLVSPEPPEVDAMRSSTTAREPAPPQAAPIAPDLVGLQNAQKRWFLALTREHRHIVRRICRARRADPCAGMLPPPREDVIPEDQQVRDLLARLDDTENVDELCFQMNGRQGCVTPLVVAFDGEPVELLPAQAGATSSPARFAFEPGKPMTSAWPTAATPWIALDRDGDGAITSGAELFGDATGDARDGFEALAALDDNRDGVVDRHDAAFAKLLLWSDANGDRQSTPAELRPLASAITAIPLAHRGVRGSVHLIDGRIGAVEDLYLPAAQ